MFRKCEEKVPEFDIATRLWTPDHENNKYVVESSY